MTKVLASLIGFGVAGAILFAGRVWAHPAPAPTPVYQYHGAQDVAYYRVSQVGAVERHMGYRIVEPTRAVQGVTGLHLSQLIVTELDGHKAIDYVYGDLHAKWVMVMETSDALTNYQYDPQAQSVSFAAHGRGINVTTNLTKGALVSIASRMGAPAHPSA